MVSLIIPAFKFFFRWFYFFDDHAKKQCIKEGECSVYNCRYGHFMITQKRGTSGNGNGKCGILYAYLIPV